MAIISNIERSNSAYHMKGGLTYCEAKYNEYVDNAKKSALYDTGKTAKYGDQLITLVTCEYSYEDGRLAVVARKK